MKSLEPHIDKTYDFSCDFISLTKLLQIFSYSLPTNYIVVYCNTSVNQ